MCARVCAMVRGAFLCARTHMCRSMVNAHTHVRAVFLASCRQESPPAPAAAAAPKSSRMKCPTITFPKLSLLSKVELSSSAAQAIIIIALQSAIAGVFASTVPSSTEGSANLGNYKSITVYLVLFILSQVFQFALVVNAV